MNRFLGGVIFLTIFIILTGQGCRYSDYIKGQFLQEKEGEICVQTAEGVICGTPEEIKDKQEIGLEEEEEIKEEIPEEVVKEEVVGYLPEKIVTEGELVSFPNLRAVDPDGDPITYKFGGPLNENGEWQTKDGDVGEYIATIYATDGKSEISQDVKIIVKKFNHPPEISDIMDITVNEGETIKLEPKITDVDGDEVTVTYLGFMESTEKQTGFKDAGVYTVTITAFDGEKSTTKEVKITIIDINPPPVFEEMEDVIVKEGDLIILRPLAFDPEREEIEFIYQGFMNSAVYKTTFEDAGEYEQTITASDGTNELKQTIKIIIVDVNRPPVFVEGSFE